MFSLPCLNFVVPLPVGDYICLGFTAVCVGSRCFATEMIDVDLSNTIWRGVGICLVA